MSKLKVTTISDLDNDNTAITVDTSGNVSIPTELDVTGNVGIGTSSPSQPLSVYGTDGSNNTALFTRSGGTTMYAYIDTGSNAGFFTGSNASGSGFYANSSDNSVRVMTASSERMRITSDGRGLSQFTAKAWIRFNMSSNSIDDSHNVSSISHPETGQTIVSLSNGLGYTNYCVVASSDYFYSGQTGCTDYYSSSFRIVNSASSSYTDTNKVSAIVFGD